MLLDSNNISIDNKPATAAITGDAIPLTSLLKPGREEPICVFIRATEEVCAASGDGAASTMTFTIQQADTKDGTFESVATATVPLADLGTSVPLAWRWLPPSVTKSWLKINAQADGSVASGKIFAAIVREDPLDYEDGMYIDKGQLMC